MTFDLVTATAVVIVFGSTFTAMSAVVVSYRNGKKLDIIHALINIKLTKALHEIEILKSVGKPRHKNTIGAGKI